MTEETLYSVQCLLMVYNDSSKQWVNCGNHPYTSIVCILHNVATDSYRFVGFGEQNKEILLNSDVYKGLKYNQATPVFHQWRDYSRQVYGIKFNSQEDADSFAEVVRKVLDSLQKSQPSADISSAGTYAVGTLSRVPLPTDKAFQSSHPVTDQPPESRAMYATPAASSSSVQSHARNAEQAYSPTKLMATPLTVGHSGLRAGLQRQPSHEQNGPSSQIWWEDNRPNTSDVSVPDQTSWTPRRSASSGNVLDNTPGLSQRLSQTADPSLFRVPSESAVQPAPPPPPLPATNTDGLAEVLRSAQLRKTPKAGDEQQSTKIGGGTLSRSSIAGNVNHQGSEMMSEMERRLHERRAKIDQAPPANNSDSVATLPAKNSTSVIAEDKSVLPPAPFKAPIPPPVGGKDTVAKSDRKTQIVAGQPQLSTQLPANVATTTDLENLKKELTSIVRSEVAAAKRDILDAISKMMNR